MTPRILITLVIIVVLSVGTGAIVFGGLELMGVGSEMISTIIAVGSMLVAGGLAALVAQLAGGFRELDEDR